MSDEPMHLCVECANHYSPSLPPWWCPHDLCRVSTKNDIDVVTGITRILHCEERRAQQVDLFHCPHYEPKGQ